MNCFQDNTSPPLVVTHKMREKFSGWQIAGPEKSEDFGSSAISVRNLCKNYGENAPIIKNMSMRVQKGTIYGLLGSSGCGKTTLLSCILGLRRWESGEVLVFGHKPGTKESGIPGNRVGFMPQELALYHHLSVWETLQFFTRLYNMAGSEVKERWSFLVKLLKLPRKSAPVGTLSGGQKRRVSLALALVHCPDLLVLDEPTVGLDPLLRRSIWNHLYKIVSTLNTTVVITTHYIEECRLAHSVGFMRNGRLLIEDSPANLLINFRCDLLEDVVLRLCRADEFAEAANNTPKNPGQVTFTSTWSRDVRDTLSLDEIAGIFRQAVGFDCDISDNLRRKSRILETPSGSNSIQNYCQRIIGYTIVLCMTYLRLPIFLAVLVLVPTISGAITVVTWGSKPLDLNFGIVNHEQISREISCHNFSTSFNASCELSTLSCSFLGELRKSDLLSLITFPSEEQAALAVQSGKAWGYLTIPTNYSRNFGDRLLARQFATNESIEGSRISVHLDMSQSVSAILMTQQLYKSYEEYIKTLAESCGVGGKEGELPLSFREPIYGTNSDSITDYLVPALIVINTFALVYCLTSILIISDRKLGMLSRASVAGLGNAEIIISHLVSQGLVVLLQIALWTLTMSSLGMLILGSGWLYVGILLFVGFSGTVLGLIFGILCKDEVETLVVAICLFPTFLIYCGMLWPTESLPYYVKIIGDLLPTSLIVTSLRTVMSRGFVEMSHALLWPGLVSIVTWTGIFWVLAALTIRKESKS